MPRRAPSARYELRLYGRPALILGTRAALALYAAMEYMRDHTTAGTTAVVVQLPADGTHRASAPPVYAQLTRYPHSVTFTLLTRNI